MSDEAAINKIKPIKYRVSLDDIDDFDDAFFDEFQAKLRLQLNERMVDEYRILSSSPYVNVHLDEQAMLRDEKRFWMARNKQLEEAHFDLLFPKPFIRVQPKRKKSRKKRRSQ